MKYYQLVIVLMLIFSIVGCQNEQPEMFIGEEPIEVIIGIEPEKEHKIGEELIIFVQVYQEGELIKEVEKVVFELWHEEDTEHVFIDASEEDQGRYTMTLEPDKQGYYSVMYHVDARGFHAMKATKIFIDN